MTPLMYGYYGNLEARMLKSQFHSKIKSWNVSKYHHKHFV